MKYQIYQITNKINNKIYIGKHECKCQSCDYFGSGKLLKRAIKKHGLDNFTKTILFEYTKEQDMIDKEKELVTEQFCSLDTNYNLCEGGKGGFGYINRNRLQHTEKQKAVAINLGKLFGPLTGPINGRNSFLKNGFSESFLKARAISFKGKKHTPETLQKMSDSHKGAQVGKKNSQYGTMWITNGVINKKIKKDLPIPIGFNKGRV